MNKFFVLLFYLLFFTGIKSFAQITITTSDIQGFIAVGNTLSVLNDASTSSLNIGNTGETSWNFNGLHSDSLFSFTSVEPSGTPYGKYFPSSTASFFQAETLSGNQLKSWFYYGVNDALLTYGFAEQAIAMEIMKFT